MYHTQLLYYHFLLIQVDDLPDFLSSSECLAPSDFHATLPDVFGSPAYFQLCLDVSSSSPKFPIARWNGPIKYQVRKVSQLIRNGIPIVWQIGVDHCRHIKWPQANKPFFDQLVELRQPQNLQDTDHTINVKSAKLGQVNLIKYFLSILTIPPMSDSLETVNLRIDG